MKYARRNRLPDRVQVNKAGGISVLSFVRHLGLPDNAEFESAVVRNEQGVPQLVFTPVLPAFQPVSEPETLVGAELI